MSHYKPYPVYKNSGIEWIGKVPEHWSLFRLANIGALMKANGGNKQDDADNGTPCIRYGDLYTTYDTLIRKISKFIRVDAETDYTSIQYGDVLFAASGETFEDIGKSAVNLSESKACCGGDVIVLRPHRKVDPVYLSYAAGSSSAQAQKSLMGKGFTVIHIYGDQLRNLMIAAPPLHEQQVIGSKVESEAARIDALIAKKTEFTELLAQKRQALITRAVTKGLNSKVKMNDSGVEWIGEVPSAWRVCSLGYVARIATGGTPDRRNASFWNGDIPWIKTGEIDYKAILDSEERITDEGLCNSAAFVANPGTVLMAMYGMGVTRGRVAVLGIPAAFNQACASISCDPGVSNWYVYYCLTAAYRFIRELGNEASQVNLNLEIISKIKVPIPQTLAEQHEIVQHLEVQLGRLDALSQRVSESINLLHKRRSALITAAVTGQIDLRGGAQ